ncbi:MAG: DegT/DnrJ/EryC1/StrS family aminotransferase [Gemmatimonadetes bacterium]|nr:MAG: DegT/DnrJ/EryC1/StrS family aminotransferase [Gemmatimonadota bacterium]
MQFIDLKTQYQRIKDDVNRRIEVVLDHAAFILGPEVREVETRLAEYVGVNHCVTCASGTDALLMALMAYDVGPGDVIFTTPFTFISTAEVISLLGATPVFVDIDPQTYNLDPAKLREAILACRENRCLRCDQSDCQRQPKGIIPVDLFGLPAEYDQIEKIAQEFDLFVLEDAAQSFGATYQGRKACSFGDVAATSFFPAKPLGCYGDGGAIFCNDNVLAEKLRSIRVHGQGTHKYDNTRIGVNGRFDTLQAAVILAKMEIFDEEVEARQRIAQRYTEGLVEKFTTPFVPDYIISAWAQYSLLATDRDAEIAKLNEQGIPTAIYYPNPLHLQTAYQYLGYQRGDFPVSEQTADHIFSVPFHPYLSNADQDRIIDILRG